jgi:hypothetical protein
LDIALLEGAFNMVTMAKGRGEQVPPSETALRTDRKRLATGSDPNEAFLRAFADALRDILHAEFRASA